MSLKDLTTRAQPRPPRFRVGDHVLVCGPDMHIHADDIELFTGRVAVVRPDILGAVYDIDPDDRTGRITIPDDWVTRWE